MDQPHIPNTMPLKALDVSPMEQLQASLEEIVKTHPPQKRYGEDNHRGLFVGPVGLAYLFLQLSNRYPSLRISEYSLREWAQKYTEADRGTLTLKQGRCGLIDEKVSFEAVRACVTQDPKDVDAFLENIPKLLGKNVGTEPMDFDSDILYGRSGALYLLRMIRHWVPGSAETVQPHIVDLANRILETGGDDARGWRWNGRWYLGAVHGDIGIITQLVLSIPELAPKLSGRLEALLDLQDEEGNWPAYEPATETETDLGRVQLCHGAPGFIYALWALRPYFPELHQRIDDAITKAQGVTWTRGMLKKEPSLCHGLFGNGLVLPQGSQRDHFLSHATIDAVAEGRKKDPEMFKPACYNAKVSPALNYHPSAAWTWAVCQDERPPMILFTDV